MHGLKTAHNTSTMEKEKRKAKITENKFKRTTQSSFDKNYAKQNPFQPTNTKTLRYMLSHLREGSKPSLES